MASPSLIMLKLFVYYIINYKTLRFSKQNRPEIIHYIKIKLIESHIAADFFRLDVNFSMNIKATFQNRGAK